MSCMLKWIFPSMMLGACLATTPLFGQEQEVVGRQEVTEERDESWYREQPQTYRPDPRSLVIQKAQVRAEQRDARMASMAWYGMSNSRPTGAPTPFTSRYSPVWEMPGGRPYAWVPQSRPGYVMYWR